MKRRFIVLLFSIFTIAAVSLIIIQVVQTRRAAEVSDTLFNISVANAMDGAITQLEQDISPKTSKKNKDIDFALLDSIIVEELLVNGVDITPEIAIFNQNNEVLYCSTPEHTQQLLESDHIYSYHPESNNKSTFYYVALIFPTHGLFLLKNSNFFTMIAAFLLLVITILFSISIRVINNQRKLDEMKTDFINNMTHEIKTPIATISLACELLQDKSISTDESQRQNFVGIINDENRRMRVLIETILQSSKMGNKNFSLNLTQIDINTIVQEVVSNFSLPISNRHGSLNTHLSEVPANIMADTLHISNLVHNLIDNAIKYSNTAPVIDIYTAIENDLVILKITDQGIGISKEDLKHIFEKFYRVSSGNVHNVKGFGIGLNYVYQVVKLHGGTISVESELEHGSTFTIELPYSAGTKLD